MCIQHRGGSNRGRRLSWNTHLGINTWAAKLCGGGTDVQQDLVYAETLSVSSCFGLFWTCKENHALDAKVAFPQCSPMSESTPQFLVGLCSERKTYLQVCLQKERKTRLLRTSGLQLAGVYVSYYNHILTLTQPLIICYDQGSIQAHRGLSSSILKAAECSDKMVAWGYLPCAL